MIDESSGLCIIDNLDEHAALLMHACMARFLIISSNILTPVKYMYTKY